MSNVQKLTYLLLSSSNSGICHADVNLLYGPYNDLNTAKNTIENLFLSYNQLVPDGLRFCVRVENANKLNFYYYLNGSPILDNAQLNNVNLNNINIVNQDILNLLETDRNILLDINTINGNIANIFNDILKLVGIQQSILEINTLIRTINQSISDIEGALIEFSNDIDSLNTRVTALEPNPNNPVTRESVLTFGFGESGDATENDTTSTITIQGNYNNIKL